MCWILEVIYFVAQSDFFAMFSTHSILCVGYVFHTFYSVCWILEVISFVAQSDFFASQMFSTHYSVCWILEVISFVTQSDLFASQMFSKHSILCVGYLKSFILSHSQISLLARCFLHILFCVLDT